MADDPTKQAGAATDPEPDWKALYEAERAEAEKWKAMSRKNEGRAKANEEAAKANSDAADQLADLSQRLAAIEGENASLKAQAERAELVAKVAKETGLDASIVSALNGADEKSLTEQAQAIAALRPKGAPSAPEAGRFPANTGGGKTTAQQFADTLNAMLG